MQGDCWGREADLWMLRSLVGKNPSPNPIGLTEAVGFYRVKPLYVVCEVLPVDLKCAGSVGMVGASY